MSDELGARRARKAVTTQVTIRVARGGYIVIHNEEVPPPSGPYAQQLGLAASSMPFIEGRETVCMTIDEVNKIVAELLGAP